MACRDLGHATFYRGEQTLHLVLVGDHTSTHGGYTNPRCLCGLVHNDGLLRHGFTLDLTMLGPSDSAVDGDGALQALNNAANSNADTKVRFIGTLQKVRVQREPPPGTGR